MKFLALLFCLLMSISIISAYEVDVDELKNTKKIKFNNWKGRYQRIVPPWRIRRYGVGMAMRATRVGANIKVPSTYYRFSMVRAISKKEPKKLSADIFSISKKSQILHIAYIQEVITGYLMKMYGYSLKDASTLAVFTTYYNAVHRGQIKYYSTKYKKVVMRHMNKVNAGIALNYYQWPGKTKIVIPLTKEAKRGKINSIDAFIISDKDTIDKMRKDDKNLKKRKDLISLKDRIIKKKKKELKRKKERIKRRETDIKKDKKDLEKRKKIIKRKEEKIIKEKKEIKKIKDPVEKRKKEKIIKKKEKDIKKEKTEIKKDETSIKKDETTIKKEKSEVKKEEKDIKKKEENLKKDTKTVKDDETKKKMKEDPNRVIKKDKELTKKEKDLDKREDRIRDKKTDKKIYANKFYYLKIKDYLEGGHYKNELYMIDAANRKILFKSPVKNISGKRYDIYSEGIVVITRPQASNIKHVLTLIDRKTLKEVRSGTENIFWRSFVEIKEGSIYAIIIKNNKYYLGKFDKNLKLTVQSKTEINKDTFITFYEKYIYINSASKEIIVLEKDSFKKVDVIKP